MVLKTRIMGILNCTPDSFYDGGTVNTDVLIKRGLKMIEEGATILDVGGESTRPAASPVALDEELARVIPVIEGLRPQTDLPISIDTTKSQVAHAALKAGANIINDITAMRADSKMAFVAAEHGAFVILMHSRGTPQTMQSLATYIDVVKEVIGELEASIAQAQAVGILKEKILIDPGIGFAKTLDHNLVLLRNIPELKKMGYPLVIGASRKSFIGKLLERDSPEDRLYASLAVAYHACLKGADILRVHDVAATRDMLQMAQHLQLVS